VEGDAGCAVGMSQTPRPCATGGVDVLGNDWDDLLRAEFAKEYYLRLQEFLSIEYMRERVFPHERDIFAAFRLTSYSEARVVILGQDPYHGVGQAHGLAFSVPVGVAKPPTLQNIYKELAADVGGVIPDHGCLVPWARQGVLLLNTTLTVRAHCPGSHQGQGWETFSDHVIQLLNERQSPLVFLLWGNHAKLKSSLLTNHNHLVLTASHPSPLSAYRGFFGCRHFSQANAFLSASGVEPIDWQVTLLA